MHVVQSNTQRYAWIENNAFHGSRSIRHLTPAENRRVSRLELANMVQFSEANAPPGGEDQVQFPGKFRRFQKVGKSNDIHEPGESSLVTDCDIMFLVYEHSCKHLVKGLNQACRSLRFCTRFLQHSLVQQQPQLLPFHPSSLPVAYCFRLVLSSSLHLVPPQQLAIRDR